MTRHPLTKLKLLISLCFRLYGSVQIWDLHIEIFYRTWRKGFRYALNIPMNTPSEFLPAIVGTLLISGEHGELYTTLPNQRKYYGSFGCGYGGLLMSRAISSWTSCIPQLFTM